MIGDEFEVLKMTNGWFVVCWNDLAKSQIYAAEDEAISVAQWLNDRAAGYPKRELPWPVYAAAAVRCKDCGGLGNYCTCCP
jgi:hypothetical protein